MRRVPFAVALATVAVAAVAASPAAAHSTKSVVAHAASAPPTGIVKGFSCAVYLGSTAVAAGAPVAYAATTTWDVTLSFFGTSELTHCGGVLPVADQVLTTTSYHTTSCTTNDGFSSNYGQIIVRPNGDFSIDCAYTNSPFGAFALNLLQTVASNFTGGPVNVP